MVGVSVEANASDLLHIINGPNNVKVDPSFSFVSVLATNMMAQVGRIFMLLIIIESLSFKKEKKKKRK